MLIAFSLLSFNEPDETENFLFDAFQALSKKYAEHTFLLISGKNLNASSFTENVIWAEADYDTKMPAKWAIWYHITIRKLLKKYKASVLISCKFCSALTKVPQVVVSPNLHFVHQPSFFSKREIRFYKKMIPQGVRKAKAILTFSEFEKKDLISRYEIAEGKIKVIRETADNNYIPSVFSERESIKEQFADGNEFFVYTGVISPQKNLIKLLKGFSAFKKRQRSGMQLVIAGTKGKQFEEFAQLLASYKFKKEIKLLFDLSEQELMKLTSASYAAIFPSAYETSAQALLNTINCEVAVLSSSNQLSQEICSEGALYFNPENEKEIAEQLMLIFKDERLRKELIEKGITQLKKSESKSSGEQIWQLIQELATV